MGRKKGRQAGEFQSKSQHALHRHTVYVDHASEANQYRNPMTADLRRGHGYRNASPSSDQLGCGSNGYWHINGSAYGGGDKWFSIFSSSRSSTSRAQSSMPPGSGISNSNSANRATMGLSRLRHLLEERRSEDRVYDRQHRLRLQRSRMIELNGVGALPISNNRGKSASPKVNRRVDRHEPGWLSSHRYSTNNQTTYYDDVENNAIQSTIMNPSTSKSIEIPSLQILAAQTLGPLLPMYCAACGSDFVGESLKSVSAHVLSELSISLATADWSSTSQCADDSAIFATTDGAIKALVKSGVADSLVLRGAPLSPSNDNTIDPDDEEDNDDTRWLSDKGLLSLCPRILSQNTEEDVDNYCGEDEEEEDDSSNDHWETLDFDMCLNSRMTGCFHLKRLELIDIPMRKCGASSNSGGISLETLRSVLRSCSGITHLSLSGCFYNWEDTDCLPLDEKGGISLLLGGHQNLSSLTRSIQTLGMLRGNGKKARELIPTLLFHRENMDQTDEIPGFDAMLPELKVLDVSYCSWVTEGQLIQLLLRFWEKAFSSAEVSSDSINEKQLDDEGENLCNYSNACRNQRQARINTSMEHINIRGASTEWLEKWKGHGLFDRIDISTEQQVRLK